MSENYYGDVERQAKRWDMLYSCRKAIALGERQEAEDQETVLDLYCSNL